MNNENTEFDKFLDEAKKYFDAGNYDLAIECLEKIDESYEKYNNVLLNLSVAYYNRGVAYNSKSEFDLAIKDFDEAIKLNSNDADAYNNRGVIYAKLGEHDKAIEDFNEAIRLNPNDANSYNGLGNVYADLKKYDEAIENFNKAIDLGSNQSFFIFEVINSFLKNNNIKKDEFDKIVEKIINHDMKKYDKPENNLLYKYRNYNDYTVEAIVHEEVTLSDYNFFNDPADPPIKLDKKRFEDIEHITEKIKITSLAEHYDNILMWSHYADSHKGICIEYDISDFNNEDYTIKKVIYDKELKFSEDNLFFDMLNKQEKYLLSIFYLKHKNFEYEDEYRIIFNDKSNEEKFTNIPLKIKSIFLGKDCSKETENRVRKLIASSKNQYLDFYYLQ